MLSRYPEIFLNIGTDGDFRKKQEQLSYLKNMITEMIYVFPLSTLLC